MSRLRRLTRLELDADQRELFDLIADGEVAGQKPRHPRVGADGGLEGPFNARLLNPSVGTALTHLGTAVRYQSTFANRVRELAILAVARHHECEYEAYAHCDIGRSVGLTEQEIAAIDDGRTPDGLTANEHTIMEATWALLRTGDLDDQAYEATRDVLGDRGLFELLTLIGLYSSVALQLRVFRIQPPVH